MIRTAAECSLKLRDNRAYWRGVQVDLTLGEIKVVARLFEDSGVDVTYREIYDAVRGFGFVAGYGDGPEAGHRQNVRSFIKRIRRKFRDRDPGFEAIENYRGHGYNWKVE